MEASSVRECEQLTDVQKNGKALIAGTPKRLGKAGGKDEQKA
jgi:hypothetical protein